jgi:uncharacterized protein YjbI with pentapeptide repeats
VAIAPKSNVESSLASPKIKSQVPRPFSRGAFGEVMANAEHLAVLKQGVTIWNGWKLDMEETAPDLSRSFLNGAKLVGIDFSGVILIEADFMGANLSRANLQEANLSRAFLTEALMIDANLIEANLVETDLSRAILRNAKLRGADLRDAFLMRTDLRGADLRDANLTGADLTHALVHQTLCMSVVGLSEADRYDLSRRGAVFEPRDEEE